MTTVDHLIITSSSTEYKSFIRNDKSGSFVLTILVILLTRPIILVLVIVVVAVIGRRSWLPPRRVSTPGLDLRVAHAGVIAGPDVVHNALESSASPPQLTAGLVEVRRRRAVPSYLASALSRRLMKKASQVGR